MRFLRGGHSALELVVGAAVLVVLVVAVYTFIPRGDVHRSSLTQARSDAQALTKLVQLFILDRSVQPITSDYLFPTGASVARICTEEHAVSEPTDCVSLAPLISYGLTDSLPREEGVADSKYTGFYYRVCNNGEAFVDIVPSEDANVPVPCGN